MGPQPRAPTCATEASTLLLPTNLPKIARAHLWPCCRLCCWLCCCRWAQPAQSPLATLRAASGQEQTLSPRPTARQSSSSTRGECGLHTPRPPAPRARAAALPSAPLELAWRPPSLAFWLAFLRIPLAFLAASIAHTQYPALQRILTAARLSLLRRRRERAETQPYEYWVQTMSLAGDYSNVKL